MLIYSPFAIANYVRANHALQTMPNRFGRSIARVILDRHNITRLAPRPDAHQLELEHGVMAQVARGELVFVRRWVKVPACFLDGVNDGGYLSPPLPVSNPSSPWDMSERRDDDLVLTAPEVAAWFGMRWWVEQN